MKIILTKGLPASGKSTWAKQLTDENPGKYKRVNKDDLRAMLDNGKWSKHNENFVIRLRDYIIQTSLQYGVNVIVDDTNLHPKHEARMQEIIDDLKTKGVKNIELEIKDFTDISVEECIKRDQKRPNYVGERVIKQMYKQFLAPQPKTQEYIEGLPDAIICDLDGTLALFGDNNPYERDFLQDKCNQVVRGILLTSAIPGTEVILVSGRKDSFREQTEKWIHREWGHYYKLFMRKSDDVRKDYFVKKEIYNEHIKGKYNVKFVLDDRDQVVAFWRSEGLTCLQVNYGDF